jgi:hypothetical protein
MQFQLVTVIPKYLNFATFLKKVLPLFCIGFSSSGPHLLRMGPSTLILAEPGKARQGKARQGKAKLQTKCFADNTTRFGTDSETMTNKRTN